MVKKLQRPSFKEEIAAWDNGFEYVIGIDEVGRGAFAGPVVVAAALFKKNCHTSSDSSFSRILKEVNDSKLLTPQKRESIIHEIKKCVQHYCVETIPVSVINKIGIGKATNKGFRKVIISMRKKIKSDVFVLVDGLSIKYLPGGVSKQKAIIKGDQKSYSIAAASIIAKVYRDNLMKDLHIDYPAYRFDIHKGYGTKTHQIAIKMHGLSNVHRKSFRLEKFLL